MSITDAVGVVVSTDLERIGGFACSDELVNRLQANIIRSQRGNFVSVPTDCPQRDERLGWTGDIQVFAPTGAFNFDADSSSPDGWPTWPPTRGPRAACPR